MEPERSFSFKIWIQNWLRNSMLTDLLGYLAVYAMHGSTILISKTSICNAYMSIPCHRMMAYSWYSHFIYIWCIRYLYILLVIEFMILISDLFTKSKSHKEMYLRGENFISILCTNYKIICNLKFWLLSCTKWLPNHSFTCFKLK